MYPKVGQLLGRLCTLPALLVIPDVYKVLIRCVLCFYSSYPVEDVGKKAKPWALVFYIQLFCEITYALVDLKVDLGTPPPRA